VTRHRVTRRLRAQLAARLNRIPAGTAIVVRALPDAAAASSAALGADLDRALPAVLARAAEPRP
jgi:ribonuclease P protein component